MSFDTVVVGGGIVGLSTAYALSSSDQEVLVLEKSKIGNSASSSAGISRRFGYDHGSDEFFPRLAQDSFEIWEEIQNLSGEKLFHRCGTLLLGDEVDCYAEKSLTSLNSLGFDVENVPNIGQRFPQFSNFRFSVFEPSSGLLDPEESLNVLSELSRSNGVEIREESKVTDYEPGSVILEEGSVVEAEKIVLAPGPWIKNLVPDIPVTPTKQEMVFLKPDEKHNFEKNVFPAFAHMESGFYGFPLHNSECVKVASHVPGETVNPEEEQTVSSNFVKNFRKFLEENVPEVAEAEVQETQCCTYSMTPDSNFILDEVDEDVYLAAGFSGQGFKFGPLIGEILSELVVDGETSYSIEMFSLERFSI